MSFTFQIVTKYEAAFFRGMTVQVDVNFKFAQLMLLNNCFFSLKDSGLERGIWLSVKPVQIVVMCIQPVVATRHPIRVDQGDDLETELAQ